MIPFVPLRIFHRQLAESANSELTNTLTQSPVCRRGNRQKNGTENENEYARASQVSSTKQNFENRDSHFTSLLQLFVIVCEH